MILEPLKINSVTVSIVSPPICHEVMGPDAMIFIFWIIQNAGLYEAQAGIKIAGRNINNLRCADDTNFVAESE